MGPFYDGFTEHHVPLKGLISWMELGIFRKLVNGAKE
jgi:hypothetical protein